VCFDTPRSGRRGPTRGGALARNAHAEGPRESDQLLFGQVNTPVVDPKPVAAPNPAA